MKLIGFDPGLAAFGYGVVDVEQRKALEVGVFRTQPNKKQRRIRKADDTADRCQDLARSLMALIMRHPELVAICVEQTALPFRRVKHSVVSALGRVRGLVDALSVFYNLPVVEETPQQLKKLICGRQDASKLDMQEAVEALFPGVEALWPTQKTLIQHAADATGATKAGLESDIVRVATRLNQQRHKRIEIAAAYGTPPSISEAAAVASAPE